MLVGLIMLGYPVDDDLALVPADPRYAAAFFFLVNANRAHLRPWHPWVDATHAVEDSHRALSGMRRAYGEHAAFQTLIHERVRLAGMVGLNDIDWANQYAVFGYWLAEAAQGRGIMTRVCAVLVDHVFDTLASNRIEIRCAVENVRSCAVAERLGFICESTLRDREWVNDRFVDHAIYDLNRGDRDP